MKSSSALSAQWMSSNTSTVGPVCGEPLEEHAPRGEEVLLVADGAFLEPEEVREARLDEAPFLSDPGCAPRPRRASFSRAVAVSSSSTIPARPRTMSASAQNATPSP